MNNDERDENESEASESDESGGDVCSSQAVLTFTLSAVTSRGERTDLSDLQLWQTEVQISSKHFKNKEIKKTDLKLMLKNHTFLFISLFSPALNESA